MTDTSSFDGEPLNGAPSTNIVKAASSMAVGTTLSRATGVLRVLVLAYALGLGPLSDAFNLANTAPNMLYDVVLGGVLAATFIPVFVERLRLQSPKQAWKAISAVVTMAICVLAAATVLCFVFAPYIVDAFTAFTHHSAITNANLAQQKAVTTTLLRWFVPQIFFYGLISLATALLNTQGIFAPPAWVPIANNVVCMAVLLAFAYEVSDPTLASVANSQSHMILLGLGTTLGVAVQAALLIPALLGARLRHLWWRFNPRHEAVRTVARLGSWTFAFVVVNQIALYVMLALAFSLGGDGQVSSYTYAWIFLQTPYAIVAVSIMSAVTPDLAAKWTHRDLAGYTHRFAFGVRAVLAVIIPSTVAMFLLARPGMTLLLAHRSTSPQMTLGAGGALAAFALGLPGFCVFQFVIRALQTMQRARTAFLLYMIENALNVVIAFACYKALGVAGLALSVSIGYSVAAVVGLFVLRRWLGPFGGRAVFSPLVRVSIASFVMGIAIVITVNISAATTGAMLVVRVALACVIGAVAYLTAIVVLVHLERRTS